MEAKKVPNKLLLLTSGGDSPGMNAAIRSVVRSGIYHGIEIYACHRGFQGLIEEEIFPMQASDVTNIIQRGGTIIRSSRSKDFLNPKVRAKCCERLQKMGINFMVAIGGDGTFRGAEALENEGGPKAVGIPGTIDNDIIGSEYTIGYDTALNTVLQAIDRIRDTASSHDRYFLVETMGRNAGFLAAESAIAGGAEYVLVPEFPIPIKSLANAIKKPRRKKNSLIIVVAEADKAGRSFTIAEKLQQLTPFQYRVCVLGHMQRGGTPTAKDRIVASQMGDMAIEALLAGKSRVMTAMQNGQYVLAPFPKPDQPTRKLTEQSLLDITAILSS